MDAVIERVLSELTECVDRIPAASLEQAEALLVDSDCIFVTGAGRSGLCMRAFGIRLAHLGKTVYIVGETITPGIGPGDLLVVGSGSGHTSSLVAITQKARSIGAQVLLFTACSESPLAELADYQVTIPAPSLKSNNSSNGIASLQPMGTLFEQCLLLVTDSLILRLMSRAGVDAAHMVARHANLE